MEHTHAPEHLAQAPKPPSPQAPYYVMAIALLVAGATWRGFAADSRALTSSIAAAEAATQPAISRAAVGRDSYADVVKMVAPGVVTIRVEGQARVAPTGFGGDDQDMLRRFFGEQFGQQFGQPGQRGQRTPPKIGRASCRERV